MPYLNKLGQADWFFGTKPSAAAQALEPNAPPVTTSPPASTSILPAAPTKYGRDAYQLPPIAKYMAIGAGVLVILIILKKMLRGRATQTPQIIIQQAPASTVTKKRRKKN